MPALVSRSMRLVMLHRHFVNGTFKNSVIAAMPTLIISGIVTSAPALTALVTRSITLDVTMGVTYSGNDINTYTIVESSTAPVFMRRIFLRNRVFCFLSSARSSENK